MSYFKGVTEAIYALLEAEHQRVEADLIEALGWRRHLPKWIVRRLGFEIVYQHNHSGRSTYRGIIRHHNWVIDHGKPE